MLHNYYFPDTAYTLLGFTEIASVLYAVVEQPFVKGRYLNKNELHQFEDVMRREGWNYDLENFKPLLYSKDYVVKDLHLENVLLTNKNNYSFIDTVPSLNTANSRYNGTRIYGNGEVIYISKNDLPFLEVV